MMFFFIVFRKFKKPFKNIFNSKILFSLLIFSVFIILQPILSGTEVTGRNVIRLTTLAYIPILILLIKTSKDRNVKFIDNNITYYIFCIFVIFHSFTLYIIIQSFIPTFTWYFLSLFVWYFSFIYLTFKFILFIFSIKISIIFFDIFLMHGDRVHL